MYELSKQFHDLKLNDIHIGLLCAIVLTTHDDLEINMLPLVKKINNDLREAIKLEINQGKCDADDFNMLEGIVL
jgi:hypothetical protein